jgi:hypothetical protein
MAAKPFVFFFGLEAPGEGKRVAQHGFSINHEAEYRTIERFV